MSDDQIRDFLRARARVEPPHDFVGSVLNAVADAPQRRTAWFAPFLPAAAAIGAVAAVAVVAVLIFANEPQVGPTPPPSPSASVQEEPGEVLLEEGDVVVMPAVDADGTYGTITIERGQTRESYESWETGNPWGASFVELHVEYAIDRPSVSSYGSLSFGITTEAIVDGQDVSDRVYFGSVRPLGGPEPLLPNMLMGGEPIAGWVVMEIPDEFPGAAVDLVHSLNTEDLGPIDWRVPLRLADPVSEPSAPPGAGESLLEVGDVVEMPATDDLGEWGTIRLERGEEKRPSDSGWSSFEEGSVLIEIFVRYTAERSTEQSFGLLDWGLRIQDDLDLPAARPDPERPFDESLTDHASASEGSVTGGWIVLEVPVVEERSGVFLTYQGGERPGGPISTPLWEVVVRERHRNAPPVEGAALLQSGDATLLLAVDADGHYGTITLDRGEDVGGYPLVLDPSSQTHFFIEIFATYELDRDPTGTEFGEIDWRVESEDGAVVALVNAFPPVRGRVGLGRWPGATVIEAHYQGWLVFAVPRDAADSNLELVYQPAGVADATRIPVRGPGEAPAPVAAEWPYQEPVYVAQAGLPFTVIDSAEADALFVDADTCTNPEGGYTVSYPDSWYTNTDLDNVPACSWFSPVVYELNESGDTPEEIAMRIDVFDGAIGFIWVDLYSEEIGLDGFNARRAETGMTKDPGMPTDTYQYDYLARLDADTDGRKLWAFTGTDYGGDYELNRAVLDRIMASLEFTE